ncbi:hypothetical protein MLD63_12490 [Paracoccus sp. TK19116]|uniref:VOC domain-containing protein n=1 Tax=Paracoccus albicereus TaxID=2922394 RepID=A0ABT1MSE6_9RHOB|nr:hypothetical protein [Paracoccus albicereus]MCQ0971240.1 hypothetical protein [Paracoccus albicereus]
MRIETVFINLNANDFNGLSGWWARLLDRHWDREPMPTCREWDLREGVLFQVLDNPGQTAPGTVTLRIANLDHRIAVLRDAGLTIPDPVAVEGFDTLRFCQFQDPEGNVVGLLEGE